MEKFDAIRWVVQNDMTVGFRRITCLDLRMLYKNGNRWTVGSMFERFPESCWGDTLPYACIDKNDPNKDQILKNVIERKIETSDVGRNYSGATECGTLTDCGADNIYVVRAVPYSLLVDKDTGFFKSYFYMQNQFGGDNAALVKHFQKIQQEYRKERFYGVIKLPYGTARAIVADMLKFAVQTSKNKKWFARDLHYFALEQVAQYQK